MIHFCYLKRRISSQEDFYDQFLTAIFPHIDSTDLIITSEYIKPRIGFNIIMYKEIDLEQLTSQKIDNIFLTEFDDMNSKFLRSFITSKCKKTEIIGLSNNYVKSYKIIQLNIQKLKENGFTNDQLSVALILKNNNPSKFINKCMSSFRNKLKNTNIKEINNISDIISLIKK